MRKATPQQNTTQQRQQQQQQQHPSLTVASLYIGFRAIYKNRFILSPFLSLCSIPRNTFLLSVLSTVLGFIKMCPAVTLPLPLPAHGVSFKALEKEEVWLIPASRTMPLSNNNR